MKNKKEGATGSGEMSSTPSFTEGGNISTELKKTTGIDSASLLVEKREKETTNNILNTIMLIEGFWLGYILASIYY